MENPGRSQPVAAPQTPPLGSREVSGSALDLTLASAFHTLLTPLRTLQTLQKPSVTCLFCHYVLELSTSQFSIPFHTHSIPTSRCSLAAVGIMQMREVRIFCFASKLGHAVPETCLQAPEAAQVGPTVPRGLHTEPVHTQSEEWQPTPSIHTASRS